MLRPTKTAISRTQVGELKSGLRRSRRATRTRINYRQYDMSESEPELTKAGEFRESDPCSDAEAIENGDAAMEEILDSDGLKEDDEIKYNPSTNVSAINQSFQKSSGPDRDKAESIKGSRFLDLNELAPGFGLEDGPNMVVKDEEETDDS